MPDSNYTILENIKSGIGEWNSVFGGGMSNNLIIGYTKQDESRGQLGTLFPFVDILDGTATRYTSFGSSRSRRTTCSATTRSRRRTA